MKLTRKKIPSPRRKPQQRRSPCQRRHWRKTLRLMILCLKNFLVPSQPTPTPPLNQDSHESSTVVMKPNIMAEELSGMEEGGESITTRLLVWLHILWQKWYTTHYMHHHNYGLLIHYSHYQHHNIRMRLDYKLYTVYTSTQNDYKGIKTGLFSRVGNQQTIFSLPHTYISNNLKQPTYRRHEP